jgi:diaminohydroxyphosphoribosylaminopyrimidine deaminase / 5-amino-6-(5-phosphoribosylamino)uracil reductase
VSRADDHVYMARAVALGKRALGTTAPNPAVGCVIVRDGRIVAEGYTRPPGGPHAEVVALAAAGEDARGACCYVSLEPCDHTGRTGPCSVALIEAGVARVVCAALDPNPIAGSGFERLRAAGIEVEVGVLEAEARAVNRGFFARMTRGRPWVRSKLAASLDGRTALANGQSQWITGPDARRDVHRFRARAGAILTGIGTVRADDPQLTPRPEHPAESAREARAPLRGIVDAKLATPPAARTLHLPGDVVIFTTAGDAAIEAFLAGLNTQARVRIERVRGDERCDLVDVVERLGALEINDVWVEAGPVLNGGLLERGLIDELVLYFAPHLLGDTARGLFTLSPLESLDERVSLAIDDVRRIGDDLRIIARPRPRA